MAKYIKSGEVVRVPQINSELEKIEQAFADTLSRSGDFPNQMEAPLDMNSQRILNLPKPENAFEPVRLIDFDSLIGGINLTPDASEVSFNGEVDYFASNVEQALVLEAALRANVDDNLQLLEGNVSVNNTQIVNLDSDVSRLQNEMLVVQNRSLGNLVDISSLSSSKADRDQDAVIGNIAVFDSLGNPVDSGVALDLRSVTTEELIANTFSPSEGDVITTTGFSSSGDGDGSTWTATSTIGILPSQTPLERGAPELVDGGGRLWRLVIDGPTVQLSKLGVKADGTDCTALLNGLGPYYIDISGLEGVYITNQITVKGLKGNTVNDSYFSVDSNFNLAASAVIRLNSNESSGIIGGVGVVMEQPNVSTRAECIQYPWALDFQSLSRLSIDKFRCSGAWNGVNARGNTGGVKIDTLEIGALNEGLSVDGALDFWHATTLHFWPFGITQLANTLNDVYYDATTIGARFGKCDGLDVKTLSTFRCRVITESGSGIGPFGNIGQLQLDGAYSTLEHSAGHLSVGALYATSNEDETGVVCTGGELVINSHDITPWILTESTDPYVLCNGGVLMMGQGVSRAVMPDAPNYECRSGRMTLGPIEFKGETNINRSVGMILQTGGNFTLTDPRFPANTGATGPALEITGGQQSSIDVKTFREWGYSIPSTLGTILCNFPTINNTSTPTVTFGTNGDFSPIYNEQACSYSIVNGEIHFNATVDFDTNAYTTASGEFEIDLGIPHLSSVGWPSNVGFGNISNVNFGVNTIVSTIVGAGTDKVRFRVATSNGGASFFSTANIPASTSGVRIQVWGSYKAA